MSAPSSSSSSSFSLLYENWNNEQYINYNIKVQCCTAVVISFVIAVTQFVVMQWIYWPNDADNYQYDNKKKNVERIIRTLYGYGISSFVVSFCFLWSILTNEGLYLMELSSSDHDNNSTCNHNDINATNGTTTTPLTTSSATMLIPIGYKIVAVFLVFVFLSLLVSLFGIGMNNRWRRIHKLMTIKLVIL